jgi:transcriptional regulator with XRE-family HTH domain
MPQSAPSNLDKELSAFLRNQMRANTWSYSQLSKKTGVSKAMLQRIVELDRFATVNLLARICKRLEVGIDEVFPKATRRKL